MTDAQRERLILELRGQISFNLSDGIDEEGFRPLPKAGNRSRCPRLFGVVFFRDPLKWWVSLWFPLKAIEEEGYPQVVRTQHEGAEVLAKAGTLLAKFC